MAALLLASRPEFGLVKSSDAHPLASTYAMLQARQNDKGGFGLWASSPQTAQFPTVYAANFLVEAKERGQKIPSGLMASVNDWLTQFAATPASTLDDGRLRAYAVYLLARQGIKANAALTNVEQELSNRYAKTWPSDLAAAYLAATYRLMQRNNDAERIISKVPWSEQKHDWSGLYYDGLVHDGQLLYLVAKHFPARLSGMPPTVLDGIGAAVSGNRQSSLSAAYTLLALDAYASASGATGKLGMSEIGKDGKAKVLALPAGQMPKVNVSENAAKVQFSKQGPLAAYYLLNQSGFDRGVPAAEINQSVEVIHEFLDMQDNVITQVKVGQEFLVRLRLRAVKRDSLPQLAVVDLLPGGVESVLELRPQADSSASGVDPAKMNAGVSALPIGLAEKSDWYPEHIDVRDDRLVLYGDVGKDAKTFVYRVRATNAGVFQAPPAFVEGMYDRTITGRGLPGKLEIVKP
jgi:hypothetical protein